jgi:uncharacterized protein (TIGR02246 family)
MESRSGFVVISILAMAAPRATSAQVVADSASVREYVETYQTAFNTHDPTAVAAFFSEDADLVFGNLPAAAGRKAIEAWWRRYFERQEPERRGTFDVTSVRVLPSDVALVNVASTTGGVGAGSEALPVRKARGTWLLRRHGGDWLITAMRGFPTEADRVELVPSLETAQSLRPQIRALVRAYEAAFNTHDPAAIGAFYTDDADIVVRNSPVMHGPQPILDWWRAYFSEPEPDPLTRTNWYESMRAVLVIDAIRMVAPDVALINITATAAARQMDAEPLPVRDTRATWVVIHDAGEWRIAALRVLPSENDRIIRRSGG